MLGEAWEISVAQIDATPGQLDLELYEGDDLTLNVTFDHDLTGYHSFRGQCRREPTPTADIVASFSVDAVAPEPNRTVVFHLASILALDGCGYDLEAKDAANKVHTFIVGEIEVTPQYTV